MRLKAYRKASSVDRFYSKSTSKIDDFQIGLVVSVESNSSGNATPLPDELDSVENDKQWNRIHLGDGTKRCYKIIYRYYSVD